MGVESKAAERDVEQRRKEHYRLLFSARRGVRYHLSRERFLMRCHQVASFLTAIVGTSAFAALVSNGPTGGWSKWLVGLAAILAALDLVLGFSRTAHRHAEFARECAELEREALRVGGEPSEIELAKLVDRRLEIEAREPAVRRVLDILCHDELVIALGLPESYLSNVTPFQRKLAQFVDVTPNRLRVKGRM